MCGLVRDYIRVRQTSRLVMDFAARTVRTTCVGLRICVRVKRACVRMCVYVCVCVCECV